MTNPATGKRQARFLPSSEWTVREEPALRIVDEALWSQVQNLSRAGQDRRLRIANLLEAIELGGAAASLNRRLVKLEQDLAGAELERDTLTPPPAMAPADATERLLGRLAAISQALAADRASATHRETLLRLSGLIERITVTPADQPRAMEVAVVPRIEAMITLALDGGDVRRTGKRAAAMSR